MATALLGDQRALFAIPREVAYFNCAYMSPLLQAVEAAGTEGLRRKLSPWEITASDFFTGPEQARERFARLIGADAGDIAVVPAASYGISTAALNIEVARGQAIVIAAEEFPSGVLVWRDVAEQAGARIVTVERPANGDWTSAMEDAIGADTAVVVASQTHWLCGGYTDLVRIGARCRSVGAALVLDVTQSAGALPIDVRAIDPDFLVAAAYKWLLGPYSVSFMYVAPRWHEGRPLEAAWTSRAGAEDFRRLAEYASDYQPGARRFDAGERSNFAALPAAIAALDQLLSWTPERISATIGASADRIIEAVAPLGLSALPPAVRSPHYLGLSAKVLPDDLPARLARRNVYLSARGDRLRLSPHLYNDDADIERLVAALKDEL